MVSQFGRRDKRSRSGARSVLRWGQREADTSIDISRTYARGYIRLKFLARNQTTMDDGRTITKALLCCLLLAIALFAFMDFATKVPEVALVKYSLGP
jgi:hypothetical protein